MLTTKSPDAVRAFSLPRVIGNGIAIAPAAREEVKEVVRSQDLEKGILVIPTLNLHGSRSGCGAALASLVAPRKAGQDANLAAPETRSPALALVEVPQALPRGLWFRAFLQRATAAERVDLRGSELLPQDVETMWTTAARSDGRRRAMAGQAHRLLLVHPGRPRSCPLLWAAAAWLPVGCRWFVVFPLGGQKKWLK